MFRKKVATAPPAPPPKPVLSPVDRAASDSYEVRKKAAEDPDFPPDLLVRLANDENLEVRARVAANPSTPGETIRYLAGWRLVGSINGLKNVYAAALNPSSPVDLLGELAAESRDGPRGCQGTTGPPKVLLGTGFLKEIAKNPSLSAEDMEWMAAEGEEVQLALIQNPSFPRFLLERLASSTVTTARVMQAAQARL